LDEDAEWVEIITLAAPILRWHFNSSVFDSQEKGEAMQDNLIFLLGKVQPCSMTKDYTASFVGGEISVVNRKTKETIAKLQNDSSPVFVLLEENRLIVFFGETMKIYSVGDKEVK
jgi:hypothetical protein